MDSGKSKKSNLRHVAARKCVVTLVVGVNSHKAVIGRCRGEEVFQVESLGERIPNPVSQTAVGRTKWIREGGKKKQLKGAPADIVHV